MGKAALRWRIGQHEDAEALREHPAIREAARMLREGKLVAFPTETVYGLGADARSEEAVSRIFTAKGRPGDNPLIVHIGHVSRLQDLVAELPTKGELLVRRFWPGPLTLVLPHKGTVAPKVTAGLDTVGVRMPSHPVALALLQESGLPVAAPSANRSGRPSPTEADHVWEDLGGEIDGLLDAGPTGVGLESTVVDVTGSVPLLLRPGGVTLEELRETVGEVRVDPALEGDAHPPRSPGMKYRHYAPKGEMWLVEGSGEALVHRIRELADHARKAGRRVGILTTEENRFRYKADRVVACGRRAEPESVARDLYRALREMDRAGVDYILAETFPAEGLFRSVMNRLYKAAGGRVFRADDQCPKGSSS
ncbi:L-threonylcarbamoyladenylate synthase [Planifilum fimeticola]